VAEKAKILLVDDRAENLVALEAILGSLNQTLVAARSGDAALKALLSDEFAVILLDVLMPGMDGFETAALIKRRPKTRDVPIIFLTALNAEPDYAFRSYSAGAVDYIAKPFDPWVLRAKVSVFVDLYTKNRQLRDQATMLRAQLGDSLAAARAQRADQAQRAEQAERAEQAQRAEQAERAGAEPVLAELSARLAAVEDMVTVLSGRAEAGPDPAMAESVHQLEHRVARLRGVFDALRVDT
jgi:CheY-like chemotaxis protein